MGWTLVPKSMGYLRALIAVIMLCLNQGAVLGQDVEVRSFLDRTRVGLGEQFTLNVEITGAEANSADPVSPDLSPFATPLGSGNSSQIQLINGRMSVSRTISFYFRAAQEGEFRVPPIRVNTPSGQLTTEDLTIRIDRTAPPASRATPSDQTAGEAGTDELFIDVTASKKTVFQGEAVVLTYDILTLVSVSSYSLVDLPATQGFWVEEYPIDQPQTRSEVLNGRRYTTATIKQMALLPTTPGNKTIAPLVVECEVQTRRRRGDFFDDLFSDPFRRGTQKRRIVSQSVEIEVLPLPEQGRPANFSGAVGKFSVQSSADKTRVEANQAITVRLKIKGQGNITSVSLPALELPPSFEVYPPETDTKTTRYAAGIGGEKTFEYVIVPRATGSYQIPAIELPYFDPDAEVYRLASTAPIDLEVSPSTDLPVSADPTISKREVELLNEDIRFLKSETTLTRREDSLIHPLSLIFGLLTPMFLLGGSLLVKRHREKLASDHGYRRFRRSRKLAKKRLAAARQLLANGDQGEFYAALDRALTGFVADRLNLSEAGMLSSQLRTTLIEKGFPESVVGGYLECMRICQQKRFAPVSDSQSERQTSLERAESAIAELERTFESAGQSSR